MTYFRSETVTDVDRAREKLPELRSYFFLSYAHSPPLSGDGGTDPDQHVREFFGDLAAAVGRRASEGSVLIPGFFDRDIPIDSDWNESLCLALGAAEVFVPLYSPGYFARSWPGREWACFHRRLELAGLEDPKRRFVPVLWTPWNQHELQGDQPELPDLPAALDVSVSDSEYQQSGLRALRTIASYHDLYHAVVNKLAERIVALAEDFPLIPSAVPDIDEMESRFRPGAPLALFVVAVAAPTCDAVPEGADSGSYGDSSAHWRPFPEQELALAEYAQRVAERLDFEVEFTSLEDACDPDAGRPGIILIDPWFIADDKGGAALQSALRRLPQWVLPVLVDSSPADTRVSQLAARVRRMLSDAGTLPPESARMASRSIGSLKDFVAVVPALVAEAERRFLRYGGGHAPLGQPGARRRLSDAGQPDSPTSVPSSTGEAPDA
jgi:FxsC-like protein